MNKPSDSNARILALDTQQSFAVSAPAGSGKTGLLTQRVLALLAQCEQPENVLAITFTKKAAAEMHERILNALNDAANTPTPPEDAFTKSTWQLARAVLQQDEKQQWQLLNCPNRLRITTIDSFCRQLSQQSPLNHRLGDAPEIFDNPEPAYLQAARDTLDLLESDEPIKDDLITLIKHFNNQLTTIEQLLVRLLSKRDQWLGALFSAKDKRDYLESVLNNVIRDHLTKTQKNLQSLGSEIALLADYAASHLCADESNQSPIKACLGLKALPAATVGNQQQWQGIGELLLTKNGTIRNRITKNEGFPTPDKTLSSEEKAYAKQQKEKLKFVLEQLSENKTAVTQLAEIKALPSSTYSDKQWVLLDSLTRVLHRLVAQLYLCFQGSGKTDYIEITLAALDALGDADNPTDLSLLLEYRLQHILVDEFQDTSSTQLSLLERLTAGWQKNDGHTLFVVGDAMQSCYRFRNANVGLFLDIRKHGLGNVSLQALDLDVNFRSSAAIVDWVNTLFTQVFPPENSINQGAVSYKKAVAFNDKKNAHSVSFDVIIKHPSDTQRKAEAEQIIQRIQSAQQDNSEQSIAILVRSRGQVGAITRALHQQGIHYRATDIDPLANNMVIQDLLSLTRALLYPHDRIAWLSLLRAPWCGLDMTELFHIATSGDDNKPTGNLLNAIKKSNHLPLSAPAKRIMADFNRVIEAAFAKQQRCRLHDWIKGTWQALGGEALLLDKSDAQNAAVFFDLLNTHDDGGRIAVWQHFLTAVEALYSKPADATADTNHPPVDIMTVHKSKGLEFDTVIIPGLDKTQRADSTELLEWMEVIDPQQHRDLLISPVNATGDDSDTIYHYIRKQSAKKQALESDRVFYVGCTRAISHLHLLACADLNDENRSESISTQPLSADDIKVPNNSSTLATIWPYIKASAQYCVADQTLKQEDKSSYSEQANIHPNSILRRPIDWQLKKPESGELLAKYRPKAAHQSAHKLFDDKNRASSELLLQRHARYFGTVLHEAIQQLTLYGYSHANNDTIEKQKILWRNRLIGLGMPSTLADEQALIIKQAIKRMLNSDKGRWILDNSHRESACEQTLYYTHKGEIKHSVIDRTFISQDDNGYTRWVIDYKSSIPAQGQALNDFAESEAAQYHSQMTHYQQLFSHQPYPIKTALYFPVLDYFFELPETL